MYFCFVLTKLGSLYGGGDYGDHGDGGDDGDGDSGGDGDDGGGDGGDDGCVDGCVDGGGGGGGKGVRWVNMMLFMKKKEINLTFEKLTVTLHVGL